MPPTEGQCCGNCGYAEWGHGEQKPLSQVKAEDYGTCVWPFPSIDLADSVIIDERNIMLGRGKTCPVWKPIDGQVKEAVV